jgi:hypothetical protein
LFGLLKRLARKFRPTPLAMASPRISNVQPLSFLVVSSQHEPGEPQGVGYPSSLYAVDASGRWTREILPPDGQLGSALGRRGCPLSMLPVTLLERLHTENDRMAMSKTARRFIGAFGCLLILCGLNCARMNAYALAFLPDMQGAITMCVAGMVMGSAVAGLGVYVIRLAWFPRL